MMNRTLSSTWRSLTWLALLPVLSLAGISRHNEQGLSPTHTYKRSGPGGVISNLNGNLVVTSNAGQFSGAPLGISLSRTWNSHWRDPLFVDQYDMDPSGIDFKNTRKPSYSDRDFSYVGPQSVGGIGTRRMYRYDQPDFVPNGWAFASAVGVQMLQPIVHEEVFRLMNNQYNGNLQKLVERLQFEKALSDKLGKSFTPTDLTPEEKEMLANLHLAGAAVQGAFYLAQGGMDDLRTMQECVQSMAGGKSASGDCGDAMLNFARVSASVAPFEWGSSAASVISYGQMGYHLAKGDADAEDMGWFMAHQIAQGIVSSIVGGGMAGGLAGVAVGAAIQMTRLYVAMVQEMDKSFDVGSVHVQPWALGVNGRLGILGVNHENERNRGNGRFKVQWSDVMGMKFEGSLHPMPDMQLVGSDGGATRFILSDEDPIIKDGWEWYPYVSLSGADQRVVYYARTPGVPKVVDLGTGSDPTAFFSKYNELQAADSGFYLVKEPNGERTEYGRGGRKGVQFGESGYHTYWAVPTRITHPAGDTIEMVRDASQNLQRVFDVRTGRGFEVQNLSQTIQQVVGKVWDSATVRSSTPSVRKVVDTVVYGLSEQNFRAYPSKIQGYITQPVQVVSWEAKRVSASQVDTTRFDYRDGDLSTIQYANGSRTEYQYPSNRQSALDGFVLSDAEYPDASDRSKSTQHVYDYHGWSVNEHPALKTSVTTILTQPNHIPGDVAVRKSEITDWYTFAPMIAAINVNRKLAGYVGRTTVISNGKLAEVDKLQDSLEYRTTRFQLVREIHGVGSSSMSRTQWVYVGDRPQGKIESRGYGQIFDPRVTLWEYDQNGSVIKETTCPRGLLGSLEQKLTNLPIGGVFKVTCPEVSTSHGVRHIEDGEFWKIRKDTVRTDSAKAWTDVAERNANFSPFAQYRIGLETSKRTWRTNAQGGDSTLIADSTEYEDWRPGVNAPAWTRKLRTRSYEPGRVSGETWPEMERLGYADADRRPDMPVRTWTRLSADSARLIETVLDPSYKMFPVTVKSYPKATTMGGAGTGAALSTTRTYDLERGWVLSETVQGKRTTTTTYDAIGRTLTKTAPDGGVTRTEYVDRLQDLASWRNAGSVPGYGTMYPNQRTLAVRETDPKGLTTEARFDGLGRLVAVRRLATTAPVSTTDTALQQTTLMSYNIFDKLQWKRDADGREEFNDFDLAGRLIASRRYVSPATGALGLAWESSYSWDDSAKTLVERDASGTKTKFSWDGYGRDTLIERDSALLPLNYGGERSAGVATVASSGRIQVRQQYANTGEVLSITDPKGLVETRKYDNRGRLLETRYPDDLRHGVGYDLAGRVVQDTLAPLSQPSNRTVKTVTYDAVDRVLQESYGSGARENTTYAWDQYGADKDSGQLMAVTRGTGMVAKYSYDLNGRRLGRNLENPSIGYSLGSASTYDVAGALVNQTIPGGARSSFDYDAFRRLGSISMVQGSDSIAVLNNAKYLRNDLVDGFRLGARMSAKFGYEAQRPFLNQNLIRRHPLSSPGTVQDTLMLQRLEWDASGNVTGMRRSMGDTLVYRHDRLGQLRITGRVGGMDSVWYDANGNRTRHRFTLDGTAADSFAYASNRVTWERSARNGHTIFRHDALGNLSLEASFAGASDTTDLAKAWRIVERKFNRRNELERVVVRDRRLKDSTVWAYDYDEGGNRVAKRYAARMDTTQWKLERKYFYDGVNVVADSGRGDSSWTWHAFQGYQRLAVADKPGTALRVRYLLNDNLGTPSLVVDDTGRVLAKYARDPWGNLETSWESIPLKWQFTGKENDPEVGGNVFYFNARFYDAERGSFIGRDPKLQFWTPYSYVGNAPLVGVDPTGLSTRLNDDRSYDCLDDGSDEWFKVGAGGDVIQRNVQKLTNEDYAVRGGSGELSVAGLNSVLESEYNRYVDVPHNLNTELGLGFKDMLWLADSPFGENSKGMNEKTHMIYGGKWFSSDEVNYLAAGVLMRWNERVDAHWMIGAIADGKLRRGYPLTAGTIMWALIGYNYKAYPSSGQNAWIRPPETKYIPSFLVINKAESNLK
ncbi:MAG TPA: RHS repeat-associated core domain-containing protein [Fibrobacteria bacterium]|nr:RHS repeat-associated core domain-containing protein [Fibrobacteria bacterium]